jgi:hypothetical protein
MVVVDSKYSNSWVCGALMRFLGHMGWAFGIYIFFDK